MLVFFGRCMIPVFGEKSFQFVWDEFAVAEILDAPHGT